MTEQSAVVLARGKQQDHRNTSEAFVEHQRGKCHLVDAGSPDAPDARRRIDLYECAADLRVAFGDIRRDIVDSGYAEPEGKRDSLRHCLGIRVDPVGDVGQRPAGRMVGVGAQSDAEAGCGHRIVGQTLRRQSGGRRIVARNLLEEAGIRTARKSRSI